MFGLVLVVLLNYSGTQANPIVNVSVRGMTLRDTAYTYLDPHGAPSAGDWYGIELVSAAAIMPITWLNHTAEPTSTIHCQDESF